MPARHRRAARAAAAALALSLMCGATAAAQVGYLPESSPYRDIAQGKSVTLYGGWFGGSGGQVAVGPADGYPFGARFDFRAGRALSVGFGAAYGTLERLAIDPFKLPGQRVTGPVDQSVAFVEGLLTLNLTGEKTWNHLAPFVGVATGLAFGGDVAADTSGYDFGTKIYFAPNAGLRVFLTPRLHLRGEARAVFWRLSYPASFRLDRDPVIPDGAENEWDLSPWLLVGLGFTL